MQNLQIREQLFEPLLQIKEVIADAVRVLLHDHTLRNADIVGIFGHQTFDRFVDSVSVRFGGASGSAREAMPLPEERRAVMCKHAEESPATARKNARPKYRCSRKCCDQTSLCFVLKRVCATRLQTACVSCCL